MVVVDTNSLVILLLGLIDPKLINTHNKTSIYNEEDFINLQYLIKSIENILVIPNIFAELDNLLNKFNGNYRYKYVQAISEVIRTSSEKYIESYKGLQHPLFFELGLNDSLILLLAQDCEYLITSDSKLSDAAKALGIKVFDLVEYRNRQFR